MSYNKFNGGLSHEDEGVKVVFDNDIGMQGQGQEFFSQNSQAEELCQTHQELLVALDNKRGELVCNKCIYQDIEDSDKASEQLTFTSYVASNLKDLFDEKFSLYKDSLKKVGQVAPQTIQTTLESTVHSFFNTIENQIRLAEQQVITKINESRNMKELEAMLLQSKDGFGFQLDKNFELSKQEIEANINKGLYSMVVQKKDTYDQLISQMQNASGNIKTAIDDGNRKIERIMVIRNETELVGKRLREIVDNCMEIDLRPENLGEQIYKRQKLDEDENIQKQNNLEAMRQQALADMARQQEEQRRLQDEQRRQQEEQKRQQEELRRQQEEQRRIQEEAAQQEMARARQAEQLRLQQEAIAERQRQEEAQRAEQQRLLQEQEQARQKAIEEERIRAQQQEAYRQQQALAHQQEIERQNQEHQRLQQMQAAQQELERQQRELQRQNEERMRLEQIQQQQLFNQQQNNFYNQQQIEVSIQQDNFFMRNEQPDELQIIESPFIEQLQQQQVSHSPQHQFRQQEPIIIQEEDQHSHHSHHSMSEPTIQEFIPVQQESVPQIHIPIMEVIDEPIIIQESPQYPPKARVFEVGQGEYSSFYKHKSMKIWKVTPNVDLDMKQEEVVSLNQNIFMQKVVNLPTNKVFIIGGAQDISCKTTFPQMTEILYNEQTGQNELVSRANMIHARAAFGCAVYPNFSQIFVAGGSINENEATKQCERYIIAQNQWKRLPDLNEAKFSQSLCFVNNGSTLYCFGGLLKQGANMYVPTSTIERLAKGQNTWKILNVRLPSPTFDMGTIELNQEEVIIFGGFNDGPLEKVYNFKVRGGINDEGEIAASNSSKLQQKDFFVINGINIRVPTDISNGRREIIISGHNHVHCLDLETKQFRALNLIQ